MAAATASSSEISKYIILGHGSELFMEIEERPKVPPGYTLVLFTQCGAISYIGKTVTNIVNLFRNTDMKDILSSPSVDILKHLTGEETIHIFTEGDLYPPLKAQLFLDWNHDSNRGKQYVVKSGMYKFPLEGDETNYLNRKIIETNTGTARGFLDLSSIKKLFEHAVYPSESVIDDVLSTRGGSTVLGMRTNKIINITLEQLFKEGGPGVYYWPICRNVHNLTNITNYLDPLDSYMYKLHENSKEYADVKSIRNRYNPYLVTWLNSYPNISKIMNENIVNGRIREKTRFKMKAAKEILNAHVSSIGRIRAGSINQQFKKVGGRRRTYRHKNTKSRCKTQKHSFPKL